MSRFRYLPSLFANLAVFNSFAYLAFARNIDALFLHYDGTYMLTDVREQLRFGQPLVAYTNNFLQSIGNIQLTQNARLLFFYWPLGWFSNVATGKIVCYLIVATMIFGSAYAMARLLSQSQAVALTAGWILGFVSMPFVPMPFFYPTLSLTPYCVVIIVVPVLTFWLVHRAGRSPCLVANGAFALAPVVLTFYLLAAAPLLLLLYAPGAAVYALMALCFACDRKELIRKLGILAFVLIAMIILRWPWYILGLFLDTAANFFPDDFTAVYHDKIYASILFHGRAFGTAGPRLGMAALMGALLSLRNPNQKLRIAAWVLVVLIAIFVTAGLALSQMTHWIFPPPIYFEMAIWPLYAVFAVILLIRLFHLIVGQIVRPSFQGIAPFKSYMIGSMVATTIGAIIVMRNAPHPINYPFPPKITPVVAFLRSTIAVDADSSFRGRILTTMPIKVNGQDAWMQQFDIASDWARREGNDELSMGLWYYRIPTLFEYNQLITPEFHALVRRALQRPAIAHQRNITVISYPNSSVLKLLGVRYVLMPGPDVLGPGVLLGDVRATEDRAGNQWRLIELRNPNLATYSPTTIETRRGLASALDFVADDRVDLTKQAVAGEEIIGPLTPIRSSSLQMAGRDLHITAESEGRTLVIVPVEFSHCLELQEVHPEDSGGTTLARIDGLLTGIIFQRHVDAVLSFRIGPLHNPLCRWEDYRDARAMLH